jgi:hypothetical protein
MNQASNLSHNNGVQKRCIEHLSRVNHSEDQTCIMDTNIGQHVSLIGHFLCLLYTIARIEFDRNSAPSPTPVRTGAMAFCLAADFLNRAAQGHVIVSRTQGERMLCTLLLREGLSLNRCLVQSNPL